MAYTGIDLHISLGAGSPSPAPGSLMKAVRSVEIVHSDRDRSGFQIVFQAGKSGTSANGFPIVGNALLKVFNRVRIGVTFTGATTVLMDGVITHQQLAVGTEAEDSTYAITGEDVSVMMDLEQKYVKFPAQSEASIVTQILGAYSQFGIQPSVKTPPLVDTPDPNEYLPVQRGTDLAYVKQLAKRFDFVFFVSPSTVPGSNTAWWGPSVVDGTPQRTITFESGPATNVIGAPSVQYDALAPATIFGMVQDRITNEVTSPNLTTDVNQLPDLSESPAVSSQPRVRKWILELADGRTGAEASARAQAAVDEASGDTVKLDGTLDSLRYGAPLKTRALVDVRGAGMSLDGKYYVRRVKHRFTRDSYLQDFSLSREGAGSTVTRVVV